MSRRGRFATENAQRSPRFLAAVQLLLNWSFWTMFSILCGCVVPLSPDFQDPPPVANSSPKFVLGDPFFSATAIRPPQTFEVRVVDPNLQDLLYVRWASDYPPYVEAGSKLLVTPPVLMGVMAGTTQDIKNGYTTFKYDLSSPNAMTCRDLSGPDHRLVVIVSDRPFLPTDQFMNSSFRYNDTVAGTSWIMAGWGVTCP